MVYLDGVLALGEGVPELDGLVARPGHDLAVVRGEGDRHHVLGVVLEAPGRLAGRQVPQTENAKYTLQSRGNHLPQLKFVFSPIHLPKHLIRRPFHSTRHAFLPCLALANQIPEPKLLLELLG